MENDKAIRLLFVDDDPDWRWVIEDDLKTRGFDVDIASNGEEAEKMFEMRPYEMVLLDIRMDGKDGWELIREFKAKNEWVAVVLYTAAFEIRKFAEAFGLGAEDYIAKSPELDLLGDRLKAIHHRFLLQKEHSEKLWITKGIVFHEGSNLLEVYGKRNFLKTNEAILLGMLCRARGKEISSDALYEGIWKTSGDKEKGMLRSLVSSLRKYFDDTPVCIKNKRWGGYYLYAKEES